MVNVNPMTADEAVQQLNALGYGHDPEWAHGEAENIVLEYLKASGAGEVAAAFEKASECVGFWYA